MLEKHEREINDVPYTVEHFPAMKGMRIAVRLAKTFGGGIGEAAAGGVESVMDMDIAAVVQGITSNLDEEETPKLILELMANTERNGVKITKEVFDKVYAANYGELLKALQFVLEVNFGGFIGALAQAGNIGGAPQANAEAKE